MEVAIFSLEGKVALITGTALYLASQASAFTTGDVIICDGGAIA